MNPTTPAQTGNLAPTRAPVFVSHTEPLKNDLVYDHRAAQAALPVRVCFRDGTTAVTVLVLTPGHVELLHLQTERATGKRGDALRKEAEEREACEHDAAERREGGDR